MTTPVTELWQQTRDRWAAATDRAEAAADHARRELAADDKRLSELTTAEQQVLADLRALEEQLADVRAESGIVRESRDKWAAELRTAEGDAEAARKMLAAIESEGAEEETSA